MSYITEDWGSTLGTSGQYSWTKLSTSWFGGGDRYFTAEDTYIRDQGASLYQRGANAMSFSVLNCAYQQHYVTGINTSLWTRLATAGTLSLWGLVAAWSGAAQNEIQLYTMPDNSTASPTLLARGPIGAGTLITAGTLTAWYSSGSWYVAASYTSNGSARLGTVSYASTTFVPTGTLTPAIGMQNLGGTSRFFYSRWTSDGPTQYGLNFNWGDEYYQNLAPTIAQMPSTLSFQGMSGVVSRYRSMNGSLHALDAHTEGFKCQCTLYWSQCTDSTLALIGSLSLTGSNGVRISCDWGTFQALYVPGSWTYQRFLDDINTTSISFLEVETI